MLQSRRSALKTFAAFLSVFMVLSRRAKPAFTPVPPVFDDSANTAAAVKTWLDEHGITRQTLAKADGGRGKPTFHLKNSFRDDPLINAGGLLLPTGFCRYCLEIDMTARV